MTNVRLAATIMLARATRPGIELYMTRRNSASAFAADAFVFPGGALDPQDLSEAARERTVGLDGERLRTLFRATQTPELPSSQPAIAEAERAALAVAAVRELFEEAGILVARAHGGAPVDAAHVRAANVIAQRARVREGSLDFADFLRSHDWYADAGTLELFSHWITPPTEARRFNTHFFFAAAPFDQIADADAVETHDGIWIAPAEALRRHREGQLHLVYPTIKHLERLVDFDSLENALAFARAKPIVTIEPAPAGNAYAIPSSLENRW